MLHPRSLASIPILAALIAGGCSDTTSPSAGDPAALATTVNGLSTTFSGNAAFQSLSALSGSFTLAAPPAARAALPSAPAGGPWPAAAIATLDVMRRLADRAPGATLALFPANVLGKTFQWDTAGARYRIVDSSLAGASPNGVRFFLYVVVPGSDRPLLPLQTIGYVDLIDVSTPQANALHQLLKFGSQTIADYTTTGVRTTSSLTLTAAGSVTDGVTPVNFNLVRALTLADSSLAAEYHLSGNGATVTMTTSVTGATGNQSLTIDWLAQKHGSVQVVGSVTPAAIDVQFKFGGTTWATVSGDPNGTPTFTGANGRTLTAADLVAMGQILAGFEAIFESLDGAFGPADLVFN
jgi:hypothetical protein